ncbi:MAG: TolB family protein, partial [Acidimicrobiia bacterium]
DADRIEPTGEPSPVIEGVVVADTLANFAVASDGTLVYVAGGAQTYRRLVWVDRQGKSQPVTDILRDYRTARLSPDGQHLAVEIRDEQGATPSIWMYEFARGILSPVTFSGSDRWPVWTTDGEHLAFHSHQTGGQSLFWMPTDGGGEAEELLTGEITNSPTSWSPEGQLAYTQGGDIWLLPLEGERKPQPFLATQFEEKNAMFSPDGRWVAFTSDRSGREEVYVKAYPGEGGVVPISTDGGSEPVWAHSGKELFYRNGDKMMVVSTQTAPTFQAGRPRLLFEGAYMRSEGIRPANYDVTADGQRFLMIEEGGRPDETSVPTHIVVVLNWHEELKRLVPVE